VGPIFNLLYQLYRLTMGLRRWIGRRFTPAGLGLLVALTVVMPLALDTENNVAYQAFCLLVALLLFAMAFGWWLRGRFVIERILPRFCTVGAPIHYRVAIRNLTGQAQRGLTFLEAPADLRPTLAEWIGFQRAEERRFRRTPIWRRRMRNPFRLARVSPAEIPTVPARQSVEVRVELVPLRRGIIHFKAAALARPDPLGLFRALSRQAVAQSLIALPKRYFLPPVALPGAMKYQQGGVALASSVGQSDEFVALRDYRRGDPLRRIHWRSWAKTGTPIVKEYEDEFFVRHALVLDTFSADPYSELFEEAVSVAASFACSVQSQESLLDLLFVGTEAYCLTAGRGVGHGEQLLEVLAEVQARQAAGEFEKLEELVLNHASRVSGCICVFIQWDAARQEMVRKLRLLGTPVLVLVIAEAGAARHIEAGPMREDPQHFHVLEGGAIEQGLARL
jgi:uncharacterized protein (DUF58 family)